MKLKQLFCIHWFTIQRKVIVKNDPAVELKCCKCGKVRNEKTT